MSVTDQFLIALWGGGIGLLVLAIYPFVIFPTLMVVLRPLLKYFLRVWWIPANDRQTAHSAAILLCAYNEEAAIVDKLENALAVKASSPLPVSVYLYLDGCSDGTERRVAPFADRVTIAVSRHRTGKSRGMKTLMEHVTEDLVLFTDANVRLQTDVITRAAGRFDADQALGCVAGRVIFPNRNISPTARSESLYWLMEDWMRNAENDVGSCLCGTGALFVIRRELFVPPPDDVIDDFHTTLNVVLARRKVVFAGDVLASERAATRPRDEFRRKVRVACRAFNCFRLLRKRMQQLPLVLQWIFLSHKLLRWFSGFFLFGALGLLAVAFACLWPLALILVITGIVSALLVARLLKGRGLLGVLEPGIGALAATSYGVFLSLRGRRFATWEPAASARDTRDPGKHSKALRV